MASSALPRRPCSIFWKFRNETGAQVRVGDWRSCSRSWAGQLFGCGGLPVVAIWSRFAAMPAMLETSTDPARLINARGSATGLKTRLDRKFGTVGLRNSNTVPKRQCRSQMCVEWRDCGSPSLYAGRALPLSGETGEKGETSPDHWNRPYAGETVLLLHPLHPFHPFSGSADTR